MTNESFEKFQLEEYKNISNSHFETVKQVSVFFRYYLLISTAPAFLFIVLGKIDGELKEFFLGNSPEMYYNITLAYCILIAIIGFGIFLYVINLRHDAVLYARTVNKNRKYFYELSGLEIGEYASYLSLPLSEVKPSYAEKTFFLPIISVFAIINSAFIFLAFILRSLYTPFIGIWKLRFDLPITIQFSFILSILFVLLHFLFWIWLSRRRENLYLKSYTMGVDIDGVLNEQTDHFIKWLKIMTGKDISKNNIKEIPVHLNKNIDVNILDEWLVFNCKEYWEQLPFKPDVSYRLKTFQKTFGYDIHFYSFRPWPIYGQNEEEIKNSIKKKGFTPLKKDEISYITKKWLKEGGLNVFLIDNWFKVILNLFNPIRQFSLTIEKGNPYVSDLRFSFLLRNQMLLKNRFQGSKSKKIKFFVEDTPENALKLSGICDYIFLFKEPYNRDSDKYNFPKNVIEVESWNEIYSWFKTLS